MRLAEYSDDEIIEELKHRGIKIEIETYSGLLPSIVIIGGVVFEQK